MGSVDKFIGFVIEGQLDEVERMLTVHPKLVDAPNKYGSAPLHYAALNGHTSR